jgi:hypothetical protein
LHFQIFLSCLFADSENGQGNESSNVEGIAAVDKEPFDIEPTSFRVHGIQSLPFKVLIVCKKIVDISCMLKLLAFLLTEIKHSFLI